MNKNRFFYTLITLLSLLFITLIPTDAEGAVYEDTVRLHILANSDSEEDQALKLTVRDAVLSEYSALLASLDSAENAKEKLEAELESIRIFCEGVIMVEGYDYCVTVTIGEEWYDTREYDDFTLPRGIYTSLRIIIGEGEGKNWWCVMYPPLCLNVCVESAPADDAIKKYTDEQIKLISDKGYRVKFKILELISDAFS